MDNKEFSILLEKRTKTFAVEIIKLSAKLPNTIESKVIRNQITKSGTSIGSNKMIYIRLLMKRKKF